MHEVVSLPDNVLKLSWGLKAIRLIFSILNQLKKKYVKEKQSNFNKAEKYKGNK